METNQRGLINDRTTLPIAYSTQPTPSKDFPYKALNNRTNEIRLVRVDSSLYPNQAISCRLIYASLNHEPPAYQALSYTWGDESHSGLIMLDGHLVPVRQHLREALQRLRPQSAEESLLIWIDAICINQHDTHEKSEQISKMKLIFERAEKVSIWIGSESATSRSAFKIVRDLLVCSKERLPGLIRDPSRAEQLEALRQLFYRDYWWRIWVIQEVVVAKKATIYCGTESISWEDLSTVGTILTSVKDHVADVMYHDKPDSIHKLFSSGPRSLKMPTNSGTNQPRLLDLLFAHGSKYSSDPRDKVFGLIGISDARESFTIDYSWSIREVYIYTAKHVISTTGNLNVICVKMHDKNPNNLPSWVPDWTRTDVHTEHRVMGLEIRTPPFKAAGDMLAITKFEDGLVLKASGFRIDTIKTVGTALNLNQVPADPSISESRAKLRMTCQAFQDWWRIFSEARKWDENSQGVFERTVFGGSWSPAYERHKELRLHLLFKLSQSLLLNVGMQTPQLPLVDSASAGNINSTRNQESMASGASLRMHVKRLVMTDLKFAGLAPWRTEVGDVIFILLGCSFPVVLRPFDGHYSLIGEVYVDEFMDGQAIRGLEEGRYQLQTLELH